MKKMMYLLLNFIFILSSCQFSKGVKKDLTTGLSASYNGFKIEDIYLADAEGNRLKDNSVTLGDKIMIRVIGVENYSKKDAKVFPGCTIILTDKNNSKILDLPDAFSHLEEGTTPIEANTLDAKLSTGNPMVAGETYHLFVRFFDKQKKESEIISNIDLKMK